jgi:hypothetical protein
MATVSALATLVSTLGADDATSNSHFRILVVAMTGAAIDIDDASPTDTILSVKERIFAANRELPVCQQRLVYRPGPHGIEPLSDDETLGGAGVARDGSAELDVLVADLTAAQAAELGRTLLEAAEEGQSDDMLKLMAEGADIDFKDQDGDTALILAAANGHADCVRLLLDSGADKEAKGENGEWTALICAASWDHADCVRLLLDAGADKEATDNIGQTALMWAARNGREECVGLLLDSGADKEAKNHQGEMALNVARASGHANCVRLLLSFRTDNGALM